MCRERCGFPPRTSAARRFAADTAFLNQRPRRFSRRKDAGPAPAREFDGGGFRNARDGDGSIARPARVGADTATCRLFDEGGEPREHFVHDVLGNSIDVPPVAGAKTERARLIAADDALRSGPGRIERYRKSTSAREVPAPGDRHNDWRRGQLVEGGRGNNLYRTSALLFMPGGGIEADEPDFAPLHYTSSLPTGLASSQTRSSVESVSLSSHCSRSSSRE